MSLYQPYSISRTLKRSHDYSIPRKMHFFYINRSENPHLPDDWALHARYACWFYLPSISYNSSERQMYSLRGCIQFDRSLTTFQVQHRLKIDISNFNCHPLSLWEFLRDKVVFTSSWVGPFSYGAPLPIEGLPYGPGLYERTLRYELYGSILCSYYKLGYTYCIDVKFKDDYDLDCLNSTYPIIYKDDPPGILFYI